MRRALLSLYGPGAGDYPGNDDLGEMSSWYVLGAIGLYPEIPGVPVLALGSPLFPHITLQLGGRRVQLQASAARDGAPYVHGLKIDGRPWNRPWLSFSQLAHARRLAFRLGPRPDVSWGAAAAATPPSFDPAAPPPDCGGRP